jgi:hypothetical protein
MGIAGKILNHYPEHSFKPVKDDRTIRWGNTHILYGKKYGKMDSVTAIYWHIHITGKTFQQYYIVDSHWQLFVKDLNGVTLTFPFTEDTTLNELLQMIFDYTDISPCQQRIIYNGYQLYGDNKYLHKDFGIKDSSTIHLILRISGC